MPWVDFEAVRVPFIVTPFKDFEAFLDCFFSYRLLYRRAALELDHSLVDALFVVVAYRIHHLKFSVFQVT